jgi:hypothetical protein
MDGQKQKLKDAYVILRRQDTEDDDFNTWLKDLMCVSYSILQSNVKIKWTLRKSIIHLL